MRLSLPHVLALNLQWRVLDLAEFSDVQHKLNWQADTESDTERLKYWFYTYTDSVTRTEQGRYMLPKDKTLAVALLDNGSPVLLLIIEHDQFVDCLVKDCQPLNQAGFDCLAQLFQENTKDPGTINSAVPLQRKLIQAYPDGWYLQHRIPEHAQLRGDLNLMELECNLPDYLTVHGNIHSTVQDSSARRLKSMSALKVLPNKLTVMGDLDLTESLVKDMPDDLTVAGELTIAGQKLGKSTIHCLSLTIKGKYKILDGRNLTVERGVRISAITPLIRNFKSGQDCRINDPTYQLVAVSNLDVKGTLYLTRGFSIEEPSMLGPNVQCQNLEVWRGNLREISPDTKIHGNLTLDQAAINSLPDGLVIPGNLTINESQSDMRSLPLNGLVMGVCLVPKSFNVPESFCCLGGFDLT